MNARVMYEHTLRFSDYQKAVHYLRKVATLPILMRYLKHRVDGGYEVVFHSYHELNGSREMMIRRIEIPQKLHDHVRRAIIHLDPDPFIK